MSDNSHVVSALKSLTDEELVAIIRDASAGRAALAAIHVAATVSSYLPVQRRPPSPVRRWS